MRIFKLNESDSATYAFLGSFIFFTIFLFVLDSTNDDEKGDLPQK
jgi:hypothetical protein